MHYPAARRTVPDGTVLRVAAFGGFLAFLDATIVNVAIPSINTSFGGVGLDSVSWVLNAYNITFAAFLLAAGALVDLLGRKRMFEWGIAIFTGASLLCGLAPSLNFLIAARVLQAVGAAIIVPASLALVVNAFAVERRSHGVGLWTAIAALAAGVGPATGGLLIQVADWRWCFLINLPIGIAAFLLSGRTLVESRAAGRRMMPDLVGAVVLAVAVGALTFAIVKAEAYGVTSWKVLGPAAVSIVLGAYFVRRCTWHRAPIVQLALLRIRAFSASNAMTMVAGAGFYSYILCNVLFLTVVWKYSALEAGLALTPGPFVAAAVAAPLGRAMVGRDARFVIFPGALTWMAGLIWMHQRLGAEPAFLTGWLPGMVILGIGAGATFPTLSAVSLSAAPGGSYATVTALNAVSRQFGATLGVACLVAIIGTPTTPQGALQAFDNGWAFGIGCFALIALGVVALGRVAAASKVEDNEGALLVGAAAVVAAVPATVPTPLTAYMGTAASGSGLATFLGEVEVFHDLDAAALTELAAGASDRLLDGGETLFEAGAAADSLFVVRSGRVEVVGGDGTVFRELGPGDVLGELAVLAGTTRSAAVRARRDSLLVELPGAHVGRVLERDAGVGRAMIRVLARQLQASRGVDQPAPPLPRLVALVPLHDGIDVASIAARLALALRASCSVMLVRDTARAPEDRAAHVEAIERDHDVVVLVGTGPGTEWTAFCARQADRVLALASDRPPPGFETPPAARGCDLVCLGDPEQDTLTPWFSLLGIRRSHRIVPGQEAAGIAALARRLTGTSVGLVLSGGGARGFAHIGVLEVLEQAGITIDRVGGTSMGAYIGGLYASGHDPAQIDSIVYEEWVRRNPLNDYRVSRSSLLRGIKARAMYDRVFADRTIELLPRAFYCCAVDLVNGELVVHRHGTAGFCVATSMLMPGFAVPIATADGRLLVDGAIRNNCPVDVMAADGEGPVIAVDVGVSSGLDLARARATTAMTWTEEDREVVVPGLGDMLMRTLMLGSEDGAALSQKHASLVIRPDDGGVGLMEFHMLDEMRAAGRRAAYAALSGVER